MKTASFIFLTVFLLTAGCGISSPSEKKPPQSATEGGVTQPPPDHLKDRPFNDDSAIFLAIIEYHSKECSSSKPGTKDRVVVHRESMRLSNAPQLTEESGDVSDPALAQEARTLFPALNARNRKVEHLPDLPTEISSVILAKDDLNEYPPWDTFYINEAGQVTNDCNGQGLPYCDYRRVRVSLPGYSMDRNQAITILHFKFGMHSGDETFLLEQKPEGWRVVKRWRVYYL